MAKRTAAAALAPADFESMIAEAACFKAEQRGFAPGHEITDWLAAEREVEDLLNGKTKPVAKKRPAKKSASK